MTTCFCCKNNNADFTYNVIEIQTLHIRDIKGERYVQAMGKDGEYGICSNCAKNHLESINHPIRRVLKHLIAFGVLIAIGIAATALVNVEELFIRLFGPIAILCGVLGITVTTKNAIDKKKAFQKMNKTDAIQEAAWGLLLTKLPKKNGDQDITYIPANTITRGMNAKQLAVAYDLLPAIAEQVTKKLKELR